VSRRLLSAIACVLAANAGPAVAAAADAPALCANAQQAAQVRALYAQAPVPPPFMAAPKLGLPEAIVLSALPADKALGVPGSEFLEVWQSLQSWERSLTLVLKAGQVFEIYGRIPPGEPSKISQNYNLEYPEAGLGGHLRPDLIAAIYAVSLEGREGPMRGLSFLDAEGNGAFAVFLPESRKPTAAEVAQFEKTRALLQGLPRACP
jgi:putative heme iron utilization protein